MAVRNLVAIFIACLIPVSAVSDERPTRSDCIIGFVVDWKRVTADRYEIREGIFDAMYDWRRTYGSTDDLAGMILKPDGSRLYLQYRRRCEDKQEMATDLIGFWWSKGLDLPEFERLPGPITPSTDTIDLRGPEWRDPETPSLDLQDGPTDL